MIDKCRIRLFKAEDLPRLHEIRVAAYRPVFQSFRSIVGETIAQIAIAQDELDQAAHLDTICKPDAAQEMHVVDLDNEIVAFCALSLNDRTGIGEIGLNAVDPARQGHGIGTWMYAAMLDRLKRAGMKVATVGTGGDPSHAPARRAYQKAGFGPSIPGVYYYTTL